VTFIAETPGFNMVRLVTHNLLACHAKECNTNNFPLIFQNVALEIKEAEFNPDFIKSFLPKVEWNALVKTAREVPKVFHYV
jgi:multifunctional methyltransferase subunit TRM112